MGAKARCSFCREYSNKEDMLQTGLGGLGGICSKDCLDGYLEKRRAKRVRRKANREKAWTNTGGRRLPGTCRDRVKRRDNETCRWCGTTNDVQIHHVRYRSETGMDSPANLISLCMECHARAHSNKRKYQPVLLTWLYLYYSMQVETTVEGAFRYVAQHPEIVDEARIFSDEAHDRNREASKRERMQSDGLPDAAS